MTTELLPCPFCGCAGDPDGWIDAAGHSGPECEECGATAFNAEAWNRRASMQSATTSTEIARLRALLKECYPVVFRTHAKEGHALVTPDCLVVRLEKELQYE